MECKNPKECRRKAEKWKENQQKYLPVGQQELDHFLTLYEEQKADIISEQHFERRCMERAISLNEFATVLDFGWVVERNQSARNVSLVLLGYAGKCHRPLHVVLNIISEKKWVAVTAYCPQSHAWKWSNDFSKKICFCHEKEEV